MHMLLKSSRFSKVPSPAEKCSIYQILSVEGLPLVLDLDDGGQERLQKLLALLGILIEQASGTLNKETLSFELLIAPLHAGLQ